MLGPQSLNTSTAYPLILRGRNRTSLAGRFTGSETLSATLWAGDDQANAATVSAAWDTSISGNPSTTAEATLLLTVSSSAISALVPGIYTYQIIADPSTTKLELARGQIQLVAGPGSATAIKVYCTAEDLRRACPWIDDIQHSGQQTGFAEERGQAREWYDQCLHAHDGRSASLANWEGGWLMGDQGRRSSWLQTQLDADKLMLRPEVVRANAYYAVSLILRTQLGMKEKTSYQTLAAEYRGSAEATILATVAELDTNADGEGDYVIPLNRLRVLRG
jgi:hypothetical protein